MNFPIYDITPFSMLDFQDHTSSILWFSGCNMRCPFCYNPKIVYGKGKISLAETLSFLKTRIGLIDAVVLSGGECTCCKNLLEICRRIKEMGFKIKVDTNCTNSEILLQLCDENLLDMVSIDYKAPEYKFAEVAGANLYEKFSKTLDILISTLTIPYEIRTTVHTELLNETDINNIAKDLKNRNYPYNYYLQQYQQTDSTIGDMNPQPYTLNEDLLISQVPLKFRNFSYA
ncbi:MAG: anaerobic ribonucleoside-triphosphate reductase activating protein [Verrucomicrobiota bacterium]|nr:anaerobic ribonucleoside-triphosphate reductase activating protein [Verrucomicrobiota bacterium]